MIRLIGPSLAAVFAFLVIPNTADALSCKQRLVSKGDSRAKVRVLCGAPVDVISKTIRRSRAASIPIQFSRRGLRTLPLILSEAETLSVQVDRWTYDFGGNRLMQEITFHDGRVVGIESLGYGLGPRAGRQHP